MTDPPARYPKIDTIGERLRWARERKGFGSAQLSINAGLSHATVSKVESGVTKPDSISAVTAYKLADLLGVADRWLVCGDQDPQSFQSARGAKADPSTANPRRRTPGTAGAKRGKPKA